MRSILVVDDQEIFRTPLVLALRDCGYEVREAATAPQALEITMRHRPDLVILDLVMPNLDGTDLLKYFRGRATLRTIPVIVMSAHVRKDYILNVATLGIKDYLVKSSYSLQDLLDRIFTHIGSPFAVVGTGYKQQVSEESTTAATIKSAPGAPKPHGYEHLIHSATIRAISSTVAEILSLASDQNSSLGDFEAVLRRDPALSAQIMATASSPVFRARSQPRSLEEAIRLLGMAEIVRIVSTSSILRQDELVSDWGGELRRLWSHSIATAVICQRLSVPTAGAYGFLLGLFHELPTLLCLTHLREEWLPWHACAKENGWNTFTALEQVFQRSRNDLASDLMNAAKIPETLVAPILDSYGTYPHARWNNEANMIDVAHQLSFVLNRSGSLLSPAFPIRVERMKSFRSPESVGMDLIPMDEQISLWESISRMRDDAISTFPDNPRKVAYWRSDDWFSPDPIEVLLQKVTQAARVEVIEDLSATDDCAVVFAEPDTREWEMAGRLPGHVLLLHHKPFSSRPGGVHTMKLPVTEAMLIDAFDTLSTAGLT